jgi:multidrug resistance efflux pump
MPSRGLEQESVTGAVAIARDRVLPHHGGKNASSLFSAARISLTIGSCVLAAAVFVEMWNVYMIAPWTRDGTVRAYVVTVAPEVVGRIVELPISDNQFVHKGDVLVVIDPTDYKIAVSLAEAALDRAKATAQNAQAESVRRQKLNDVAVSDEEKQSYASTALAAQATYQQAVASLNQARVNLGRTRIVSPVNGYVTNLLTQQGDYATVGKGIASIVNSDSFWVDGYFEETSISEIHEGDPATVKLMGYSQIVRGHVDSIARGITVANAHPDGSGLASVNPIFTWIRLAQRVPVRIHVDQAQEGVRLVAGLTGTVEIDPRPDVNRRFRSNQRASVSLRLSRSLREWVGRIWR